MRRSNSHVHAMIFEIPKIATRFTILWGNWLRRSLCFTAWSFRFLPCWLLAITVSMGFIWLPISGSQPVAIWIFLLLLLSRLFTVFDFMPYHTTPEVEAHILSYQNATYTISPLGLLIWLPHCNGLSKGISILIWRNLAWSKLKPLQ